MATQTRRIARCSTIFFRAASKASMVTAWCGLVLMSAVAAHAGQGWNSLSLNGAAMNGITLNGITMNGVSVNGLSTNGITTNGIATNGITLNGITTNGIHVNGIPAPGFPMDELFLYSIDSNGANYSSESSPSIPHENLPWATLSHQGLGKNAR